MNTLYNRPDNSASVHHQHQPHMHSSTPNHHSHSQAQQRSQSFSNLRPHMSRLPLDGRVRGDDGRFMSRTDIINPIYHQQHRHNPTYHRATASSSTAAAASPTLTSNSPAAAVMPGALKVCGWCGRTSTSQWRVGPTNGSLEMATLCNACGINYRRALSKTPTQHINLDRLAQQTGSTRLSIQKALKRQRKVSSSSSSSSPHSSHSSSSSPSSPQHRTVRSASQPPPMKSSPTNSTATSATIPSSSSSSTWHSAGGKISVAELLDDHNTSSPMSSSKTHGQLPPKYGMQEKAQVFTHQNQQQSSASIGRLRPYIHFPSQPTQQHQQQHQHQPSSSTSRHLRNGPHMGGGGGGRMSNVHHNEQHHHHAMASSSSRLGKQVNGSTSLPSFNNLIGNLHLQQN